MTEITLLDRYKGALVGVHVGDAIGAPYEKAFSAKQIATDIEARGGLKFFDYPDPWAKKGQEPDNFPAGRPTDDSDQTADLAWSIIECGGALDTEHLREALRDSVVRGKSRLWSGVAKGAGGTTRKALSDDPVKVAEAMSNPIGTNGSLMRCAPISLLLGEKPWVKFNQNNRIYLAEEERLYIEEMSSVTHANPNSIDACWIYTKVFGHIIKGIDLQWDAIDSFETPLEQRIIERLRQNDQPIDPGKWPGRGEVEFSLYAALWCFKNSTSFADGIEKAVRIGGDTDTYAAIAGGLLGAYYGYEAIPLQWRKTILGHDVMVGYAEKLYELNQQQ
jgi:ADP-ribosyl-[dinitrogen reductase] hydrolase